MLNLDEENLPMYEFSRTGTTYKLDPVSVGFQLQEIAGEQDPEKVAVKMREITGVADLTAFEAMAVLVDFQKFMEVHGEVLKKVFGQPPSSTTTTASTQASTTGSQEALS